MVVPNPALAWTRPVGPGFHHPGFHPRFHHGFHHGPGVGFGVGVFTGVAVGAALAAPYYYYPSPVYVAPAPVYAAPPAPTPTYWYYCTNPAGYYPYVPQCPGGWMTVVPTPQQ
jgi:hypothetical protein